MHNPKKDITLYRITGNWITQSKNLKEKYALLTDTDLKRENGKDFEVLARISSRLNKAPEEVMDIINNRD